MGIWEAMEKLSELVDDSDPDVSVPSFPILSHAVPRACVPRPFSFSKHLCYISDPDVTGCFRHYRPGRDFDLMCFLFILLDDRLSDRTSVANRRGHSARRQTGMDASNRARARPGKTFILLWIPGSMGCRRRHFRRRVQVFG